MFEIVIQVNDQSKAQILHEILQALDFVDAVQVRHVQQEELSTFPCLVDDEFFAFAGIWADRETTLSLLRNKAWFQS